MVHFGGTVLEEEMGEGKTKQTKMSY